MLWSAAEFIAPVGITPSYSHLGFENTPETTEFNLDFPLGLRAVVGR
jgi:hypothetical protein